MRVAVVTGVCALLAPVAHAERPVHASLGVGGYGALAGPDHAGLAASGALYPGGGFDRFGLRAEAREVGDFAGAIVLVGLGYEAAAARPRLVLSFHADAGALAPAGNAVLGAGLLTELEIVGPLAVGLDTGALFVVDGVDSTLALGSVVTLRVAR